jgi:hypothetical protein
MSAHRLLQDAIVADHTESDPGASGNLKVTKHDGVFQITTSAAESRFLVNPTGNVIYYGARTSVALDVDGGNLTVQVKNAAGTAVAMNAAGNTSCVLDTVGDRVTFVLHKVSGVARWLVESSDGAAFS